jgi:hypothetical protein
VNETDKHEQQSCLVAIVGLVLPFIAWMALLVAFPSTAAMGSWKRVILGSPWVLGLLTAALLAHRWKLLQAQPSNPVTANSVQEREREREQSSPLAVAAVMVLLLCSGSLGSQSQQGWLSWGARNWPTATGLVEGCRLEPFTSSDDGKQVTDFYLSGSYVYRVGDELRRGYRLEFFPKPYDAARAEDERRQRFAPGTEVQVVYDPQSEAGSFLDDPRKSSDRECHLYSFAYAALILTALVAFAWDSGCAAAVVAGLLSGLMVALSAYGSYNQDARTQPDVIVEAELDPSPLLIELRKPRQPKSKSGVEKLSPGLSLSQVLELRGRPYSVQMSAGKIDLLYGTARQTTLTLGKNKNGEYRLVLPDQPATAP